MSLKSDLCELDSISVVLKTLICPVFWYPIYKKTQIHLIFCTQHFFPVVSKADRV